ncbi:hypothetical protein D6D13_10484 [Aureobasidium pullulans]|uniref:Integral membrane protein n=1 Tax=Aureobasidium pullulans TaxID=5580 RepID=A0A4S9C0E4_AURPU|nr:hypothetical protein D6D13_10484 [Aureobasidium pullulans]
MSADLPQFTGRNNNTQAALLVPTTITLTLGLVLYGVRIRARRSSPLVWIDGMITAALVLAVVDFVLTAISCHYGLGRHTTFVDSARSIKALYFGFLTQPICCQPISALWDGNEAAHCWSPQRIQLVAYVTLGFGVVTSMLLSLTPVTFVKGANRPLHELIALGLLFGMLKSLKTTIQWGSAYDSTAHLPSIVKTTEVVHSTEVMRDDGFHYGSPARRPSWQ